MGLVHEHLGEEVLLPVDRAFRCGGLDGRLVVAVIVEKGADLADDLGVVGYVGQRLHGEHAVVVPAALLVPAHAARARVVSSRRVVLVAAGHNAAPDDLRAPPLRVDDVAGLYVVAELPNGVCRVLLGRFSPLYLLELDPHLLFARIRLKVPEFAPAEPHDAALVEVVPHARALAGCVEPVVGGLDIGVAQGILLGLLLRRLLGGLLLLVYALRFREGGPGELREALVGALARAELALDGVADIEVPRAVVEGRVFLFRDYLREVRTGCRRIAHEPAVARVEVDEVVRPDPVEPHGELPAQRELAGCRVVRFDEAAAVFLVVLGGEGKPRPECAPEVVDVLLAAPVVVRERVEGGVQVVEHGQSREVLGLARGHPEPVRDAGYDLLPVRLGDALVEQAEHGERVDVGWGVRAVELGELDADVLVHLPQLADEPLPVVAVVQEPVCQLGVEPDPRVSAIGHAGILHFPRFRR